MSDMLPQELHSALSLLLQALQSSDNAVRTQAEERLNTDWVTERQDVLLMGLVEQMHGSPDAGTRSFAAVLFRRIASKSRKPADSSDLTEVFTALNHDQKTAIRAKLLACFPAEQLPTVRNKIGDAVAEIARQYTDKNEAWHELLEQLFQSSQSNDPSMRAGAFKIFTTTPGIIEKQHESTVQDAFSRGLKDESIEVKLAALNAYSSFFHSITKKTQSKYFNLLPEILNILPPLKDDGDNDNLQNAFLALTELAEACPRMFKSMFNNLVKFSIGIIQTRELDDVTRQQALELMSTFAEHAPIMCKKDPSFTQEMVIQCLALMTDVGQDDDDAEEWNASEDLDQEESDLNHVAAEQCMDRLANRLGGEAVLPNTFSYLPGMIMSSSWKERHAALMAISAISEGCREPMMAELDKVLQLVVPTLLDSHSRVRWAGCNALGQMSTDFASTMQEKYHEVILKSIMPVLAATEPRVQSHAAAALVNFCEEAEKSILEPYLDELLSHLLRLLQSPKRFVQEQALSTIATIADSAEAAFGKYYDTLMPLLFNVLREEQSKEYRLLRAKAMECATLIALAVGKEKMGPQALELVQILGNIQQGITDADDPQASYLLHCWGRMCRVLDKDFVPYLPGVMPPLLEIASAKADIQLLDDQDQISAVEEDGWELVPLKGKVIGIKTAALDEKNVAIELLTIYAQILEGHFESYVLDIASRIAFPGLAFFFHDPVRVSSAKLIPALLNSYKLANGRDHENFKQLWFQCAEKVIEVLTAEPAIDTLAEMYQCFYESVEVVGKDCLNDAQMAAFIESTKSALNDYQDRVKARIQEQQEALTTPNDEEDESDSLAYAIEDDESLLSDMNKSFHTIFKNMGPAFIPTWQTLLPYYDSFAISPDPTQRQWALCIFDDVLEFTGAASWTFHTHIITPLVNGMQDPNAANRQAAVYGAGIAAQKGGPAWADFAAGSLPLLFQATRVANARGDDNVYATENACAAIAKVLHYNSSKVANAQAVVAEWLGTLPVVSDEETAPYAYSFLAELIDQSNPAILQNPTLVFQHIVQALEAEALQGQIAKKVVTSAKALVANTGLDAEQVLQGLSEEGRELVRKVFQEVG